MAVALVAVILLPQPGEEPVAEEPADPAEDDFEYWNQLRRARGWSEVVATIPRQRHGAAAPHAPAKDRPKRKKRRAVSSSGKAQGATAAAAAAAAVAAVAAEVVMEGEERASPAKDRPKRKKRPAVSSSGTAQGVAAAAAARTAAPMERLEAAAAVARAAAEVGEAGAAAVAQDVQMVVEASATAGVAAEKLAAAAATETLAAAAAAAEVVMEGEEGARAVARTQLQGDPAAERPVAVVSEPATEPAAERLRIRLAPRPVALRQHTQRLGSDAESREQPDTLQKLDLVRGGGAVPTDYCVRAARAAQAAGAASKLTISLLPRGAPSSPPAKAGLPPLPSGARSTQRRPKVAKQKLPAAAHDEP